MSVYLNNATTGYPKAISAVEAYSAALQSIPSDVRHSAEPQIELVRGRIGSLLGVDHTHLFFLSDATLALNAVIRGYVGAGDHCVTDNRSHNAVLRTLNGIPGVSWQVARVHDLHEEPDFSFLDVIDEPKLVCLTHTSNVTGSVYDVTTLIRRIRSRFPKAAVLVDASQSVGFAPLTIWMTLTSSYFRLTSICIQCLVRPCLWHAAGLFRLFWRYRQQFS